MMPGADEVHLWTWPLDIPAGYQPSAWAVLDADERARADRFHFPVDRTRFIAARAGLRRRLGLAIGRAPESFAFRYGPFGKPALADHGGPDLRFNLCHSGDLALLAASTGFDLGVDVERLRDLDAERVASATFAPAEAARIASLPPAERLAAFFCCWTRKEAYVKALGRGFDLPLASFTVSLAPGEPPRLLSVDGAPDEPSRWRIVYLQPCPGYVGTIAARRTGWRIVERE